MHIENDFFASISSDILTRTTRQEKYLTYVRRRVDFFIFVVNGLSVLKCLESNGADTQYIDMVTEVFSSPSLTFKGTMD